MKVKIKSWDRLVSEFGCDSDGDVKCVGFFTKEMEENIPENREIEVENHSSSEKVCGRRIWIWNCGDTKYMVSEDTVEKIIECNQNPQTEEERAIEYKRWLDKGKPSVWMYGEDCNKKYWKMNCTPSWSEEATFVIDDEYADLKKAWYDGETIQFKTANEEETNWIDIGKPEWSYPPEYYRVKSTEWYNNIPKEGILCWVRDDDYENWKMFIINSYDEDKGFFRGATGWWWNQAKPVTKEEALRYIYEENK